jgi:hypothetical protein
MTWNRVAALLMGVLLTLPLVGLLVISSWRFLLDAGPGEAPRLVPHLRGAVAMRVETFQHPCQEDKECKRPLSCFVDRRNGHRECRDSDCMADEDCSAGFTCQPLISASDTALFRICVPLGVRKEGEGCEVMPQSAHEGCEQGLRCDSYCGRACQPGQPGSCPEGFFCKEKFEGPICLPTCEERTCPEGQQCLEKQENVSICARVEGPNCLREPCPGGQRCSVYTRPSSPHVAWTSCRIRCSPERQDCPGGMTCFHGTCYKPCTSNEDETCGPEYECRQFYEGSPRLCAFRYN